jgi:hypothetical protein
VWGWAKVYHDATHFDRHLSTCAFSRITKRSEQTFGLKYTGLNWLLNKAIDITFSMRSGASGWSVSPGFTYYATVNDEAAPAFRIIKSLERFVRENKSQSSIIRIEYDRLLDASSIKIGKRRQMM